jgi:hypothetical protein
VTGWRSAARAALLLLATLGLVGCGGRTDAHVVDDLVDGLLTRQAAALELAIATWDGAADPLTAEVDDALQGALIGRALERARAGLPAAVHEPAAVGVAAVSLRTTSPDAGLGQVRDWRLRDAIVMASFTDADLADLEVLDSTCAWDR